MFICKPCLEKHYTNNFLSSSQGTCEVCKKHQQICVSIPSSILNPKKPVQEKKLTTLADVVMTIRQNLAIEENHDVKAIIFDRSFADSMCEQLPDAEIETVKQINKLHFFRFTMKAMLKMPILISDNLTKNWDLAY